MDLTKRFNFSKFIELDFNKHYFKMPLLEKTRKLEKAKNHDREYPVESSMNLNGIILFGFPDGEFYPSYCFDEE